MRPADYKPHLQKTSETKTDCQHISYNMEVTFVGFDNSINKVVLEPRVLPENTSKYVDTVTVFAKTWIKSHWPLDDLWPHICWGLMCDSTQGSLCRSPMRIHQSMWIQWPFLQKTWTKGYWPLDDIWPDICWGHMCDSTQGSLFQVPWEYINVCGYSDQFCKLPHRPTHIHILRTTYYIQNEWSLVLLSLWPFPGKVIT